MRTMARRRVISLAVAACAIGAAGVIRTRARERADMSGDIAYGSARRQRLNVYAPEPRAGRNRPVVVYFYGGAWQSGNLMDALPVGQALAEQGIAAVTPSWMCTPSRSA